MARPNFDPVLLNGPPTPEEMVDLVQLEPSQYETYVGQYRVFMQETRAARDTAFEMRRRMRERMGESGAGGGDRGSRSRGDMEARRAEMERVQKQMQGLERQQKAFDENLKALLTEPQFKKYAAWREEQKKSVQSGPGQPIGERGSRLRLLSTPFDPSRPSSTGPRSPTETHFQTL